MVNINDIVYYKTPINFKNWGTVKLIFEVKDSVKEEEKNKIIYRVVPLIKDGTTYYDDIEISDIYESYSKKIWTRFGIKLRFLVRNSKK